MAIIQVIGMMICKYRIFFHILKLCTMRSGRQRIVRRVPPTIAKEIAMSRIAVPAEGHMPSATLPLLDVVRKRLGVVPNLMRVVAHSPAALAGYLALNDALSRGGLGAKTGERIALAVAQLNGCEYCIAAHTYLGRHVAKLDDDEMAANRGGASRDAKADAAVRFAVAVASERGHVPDSALAAVKDAGYDDADVIEIVAHVALNTLTNYVNVVAQTPLDFPAVELRQAA
jgi:uncharacterized peroxidase-related enzyme